MEKHKFDTLGVMLDMSRNAVMNLTSIDRYFALLKKMGYNTVFLYTEDTYELNDECYFGYMRGRYSKSELKEIDEIGNKYSIEVIPCIQTLAHLDTVQKWNKFTEDTPGILLVDDYNTYRLIENMFKTAAECFTTRRIHIGMDEAHMLGRGKHLDIYGYETVDVLMKRHLEKVVKIAKRYGFEPMIWSDMFFRGWNNGQYYCDSVKVPEEYVKAFPKELIPVYWDYYRTDEKSFSDMLENHAQLSDNTWFAGGVWTWSGFTPHNSFSLKSMLPAIDACKKHKIKNIFFTMWGDNGAECSRYSTLPALFYLAEYARGNTDDGRIKRKFKTFCGIDFDDFMLVDTPNNIAGNEMNSPSPKNPSKYMLYSDCFNGHLDYTVKPGSSCVLKENSKNLHAVSKKSKKYGYLFDTLAKLCDVLYDKYELGVKTRQAYQSGDKEKLLSLANVEYARVIKSLKVFSRALEKQWLLENKTYGFEVQELRLGGLINRVSSCRKRIKDFVNGKIARIEELECDILPFRTEKESTYYNSFQSTYSSNPI